MISQDYEYQRKNNFGIPDSGTNVYHAINNFLECTPSKATKVSIGETDIEYLVMHSICINVMLSIYPKKAKELDKKVSKTLTEKLPLYMSRFFGDALSSVVLIMKDIASLVDKETQDLTYDHIIDLLIDMRRSTCKNINTNIPNDALHIYAKNNDLIDTFSMKTIQDIEILFWSHTSQNKYFMNGLYQAGNPDVVCLR